MALPSKKIHGWILSEGCNCSRAPPPPASLLGGQNVIQPGRGGRIALQLRVAQSTVVIQMRDRIPVPGLQNELDRRASRLGPLDRILQHVIIVRDPVHGENLAALDQARLESRSVPEHLADAPARVPVIES